MSLGRLKINKQKEYFLSRPDGALARQVSGVYLTTAHAHARVGVLEVRQQGFFWKRWVNSLFQLTCTIPANLATFPRPNLEYSSF